MLYAFGRKMLWLFLHIVYNIKVYGQENIPPKPNANKGVKSYIIAANHQNYLDPPVLAVVANGKFSFMAKSELFEGNKFFAWLITILGAFPIHRGAGDNKGIERAIADIERGRIFMIFPEGMRSKDGKIGRAKSGVTIIASQTGAPILPCCIKYGEKKKFRRKIYVSIGEMISPRRLKVDPQDRHSVREVSNTIMNEIKMLMEKMA